MVAVYFLSSTTEKNTIAACMDILVHGAHIPLMTSALWKLISTGTVKIIVKTMTFQVLTDILHRIPNTFKMIILFYYNSDFLANHFFCFFNPNELCTDIRAGYSTLMTTNEPETTTSEISTNNIINTITTKPGKFNDIND